MGPRAGLGGRKISSPSGFDPGISDADFQNLYFSSFYHELMLFQCLSHVYKFWLCVISHFLFIICIWSSISVNYNRLSFGFVHLVNFFSWKSAVRFGSVNNKKCVSCLCKRPALTYLSIQQCQV